MYIYNIESLTLILYTLLTLKMALPLSMNVLIRLYLKATSQILTTVDQPTSIRASRRLLLYCLSCWKTDIN